MSDNDIVAWLEQEKREENEMAKKQKAESELREITIHGAESLPAARAKSVLCLFRDEEEPIGVTLHLSLSYGDDPDLDAMLAPGGKYSVTIRREEGS